MVNEDDLQFSRFWDAYPNRVAKKEARKAWLKLNPTPAVVDKMIETLTWQRPMWAKDGYRFTPYPASWLNGSRWDDEPPPMAQQPSSWICRHVQRCAHRAMCAQATILGRPTVSES